jgi:hypothetical protein
MGGRRRSVSPRSVRSVHWFRYPAIGDFRFIISAFLMDSGIHAPDLMSLTAPPPIIWIPLTVDG